MFPFSEIMEFDEDLSLEETLAKSGRAVDPFDLMKIIYTSGTNGFSNGGLSMHRNNMAYI